MNNPSILGCNSIETTPLTESRTGEYHSKKPATGTSQIAVAISLLLNNVGSTMIRRNRLKNPTRDLSDGPLNSEGTRIDIYGPMGMEEDLEAINRSFKYRLKFGPSSSDSRM